MRHKHADLIIAWANGADIQYKYGDAWFDCVLNNPNWVPDSEYRIKPKPLVKKYYFAYLTQTGARPNITSEMYTNEQQMRDKYAESRFQWILRIDASVKEFPDEE